MSGWLEVYFGWVRVGRHFLWVGGCGRGLEEVCFGWVGLDGGE